MPANSTVSPLPMSVPANDTAAPGVRARRTTTVAPASSRSVSSTASTASAPRGSMPPVAIGVAVPRTTSSAGATPVGNRLGVHAQAQRRLLAGAERVLRAHREAVEVRAVEAGHVHLGAHVLARARARARARERPSRRAAAAHRSPCASAAPPRRGRAPRGIAAASRVGPNGGIASLSRPTRCDHRRAGESRPVRPAQGDEVVGRDDPAIEIIVHHRRDALPRARPRASPRARAGRSRIRPRAPSRRGSTRPRWRSARRGPPRSRRARSRCGRSRS